jgi:hypothetical protein
VPDFTLLGLTPAFKGYMLIPRSRLDTFQGGVDACDRDVGKECPVPKPRSSAAVVTKIPMLASAFSQSKFLPSQAAEKPGCDTYFAM